MEKALAPSTFLTTEVISQVTKHNLSNKDRLSGRPWPIKPGKAPVNIKPAGQTNIVGRLAVVHSINTRVKHHYLLSSSTTPQAKYQLVMYSCIICICGLCCLPPKCPGCHSSYIVSIIFTLVPRLMHNATQARVNGDWTKFLRRKELLGLGDFLSKAEQVCKGNICKASPNYDFNRCKILQTSDCLMLLALKE